MATQQATLEEILSYTIICDYMCLLITCDYFWSFLQLFKKFGHSCNYVVTKL
jgi:hypothetical protein